jgi:hypothetical protein
VLSAWIAMNESTCPRSGGPFDRSGTCNSHPGSKRRRYPAWSLPASQANAAR